MKKFLISFFLFSLILNPAHAASKSLAKDPRISRATTFSDVNICKTTDVTFDPEISSGFPRPVDSLAAKNSAKILLLPFNLTDYKFLDSDLANYKNIFKSVKDFYSKMSFGRFKLDFIIAPKELWIELPKDAQGYGIDMNREQQDNQKVSTLVFENASESLKLNEYDSVIVSSGFYRETGGAQAFPNVTFQSKSGPINNSILVFGRGAVAWPNIAHEIGHANFGLEDLYLFKMGQPGTIQSGKTIAGWDLMAGTTPDFTGWNKILMGFIQDKEIKCLTNKTKKIIYLSNTNKIDNTKIGVINLAPGVSLCFEAKKDLDGSTGLLVYKVDTNYAHGNGPFAGPDELIKSGKSYSEDGYKFKVLGTDASGLLVQVN